MPTRHITKPASFKEIHAISAQAFDLLREWYEIGDAWEFSLASIDVDEVEDLQSLVAFTMRKLQALRLWSGPHGFAPSYGTVAMLNDVCDALGAILSDRARRRAHPTHILPWKPGSGEGRLEGYLRQMKVAVLDIINATEGQQRILDP